MRQLNLDEVAERIQELRSVYAQVYREAPYHEDEGAADEFAEHLAEQRQRPGFTLVVAEAPDGSLVGFSHGLTFPPDRWWRSAGDEPEMTKGAEKFALMEFVVLPSWRGKGIGTVLMSTVLRDRPEPFATLCANPAALARRIYESWGWQQVGTSHPPQLGPMDVLVLRLNHLCNLS